MYIIVRDMYMRVYEIMCVYVNLCGHSKYVVIQILCLEFCFVCFKVSQVTFGVSELFVTFLRRFWHDLFFRNFSGCSVHFSLFCGFRYMLCSFVYNLC